MLTIELNPKELNLNELQAVTGGGHKSVSAATSTTSSQLSVSTSYSVSNDVQLTSSTTLATAAFRRF